MVTARSFTSFICARSPLLQHSFLKANTFSFTRLTDVLLRYQHFICQSRRFTLPKWLQANTTTTVGVGAVMDQCESGRRKVSRWRDSRTRSPRSSGV